MGRVSVQNPASRRTGVSLRAGAAAVEITPSGSVFLFGYPHVKRYSTGVLDPLFSSALYLTDSQTRILLIASDLIYLPKALASRARSRIEKVTGIPAVNVILTATHTHSGPIMSDLLACQNDPAVPRADTGYWVQVEDAMVRAGQQAVEQATQVEMGITVVDGSVLGGNRHDPDGPSDPQVPVFLVRRRADQRPVAVALICSVHPTVLHEDSTLISADFPGTVRDCLQSRIGYETPVLHFTGPCGNQSPRHVVRGQTPTEARRLGETLGQSILRAMNDIEFCSDWQLTTASAAIDLPPRSAPSTDEARIRMQKATKRYQELRSSHAPTAQARTAECDVFGTEAALTLAMAAKTGHLAAAVASALPAEVSVIGLGPWTVAFWPGEAFVEFSLAVKRQARNCFVVSLANGELQGYLTTGEAEQQGWYEGALSIFANPDSGDVLVKRSLELIRQVRKESARGPVS